MARFERRTFELSRDLEYFSVGELEMQVGHPREWWPVALVKELVDNALDACESAEVAPEIVVRTEGDRLTVIDNGPGLPAATLIRSLDYGVRVSDKVHYVSPTRGQLGNALKVLWAAPFVASEQRAEFTVYVPGEAHRVEVDLDRLAQRPRLTHEAEASEEVQAGTKFVVRWPGLASYLEAGVEGEVTSFYNSGPPTLGRLIEDYAACNPHARFAVNGREYEPTNTDWRKWRAGDRTSAHWYTPEELRDLIAAYILTPEYEAEPCTVRAFVSEFKGLSGTAKQGAVTGDLSGACLRDLVSDGDVDMVVVAGLLERMQAHSTAPKPQALGKLGREHLTAWLVRYAGVDAATVEYKVVYEKGAVPGVTEAAFGVREDEEGGRRVTTGLNWAALMKPLSQAVRLLQEGLVGYGDGVVVVLHVARPKLPFTDRGKGRLGV